jgi:hypothetical protein
MKKSLLLLIVAAFFTVPSNAQFLNRLTDKAMKAAEKGVTKAVEKSVEKTTEKATEKILGTAEKAVEKEVDKAADAAANAATNATKAYTDAVVESANEINASANELNRVTDSIRVANGQPAQASGAGMAGLMSSYMTLMGAGTPTIEDKGDEVILAWQYIQFNLEWHAKFKGEQCSESKMMYIFQTPELATQYYREQTADMDKDKAKLWSVQDKTVIEDNTQEYSNQDKVAVKAAMQQIVLSMGGKLE